MASGSRAGTKERGDERGIETFKGCVADVLWLPGEHLFTGGRAGRRNCAVLTQKAFCTRRVASCLSSTPPRQSPHACRLNINFPNGFSESILNVGSESGRMQQRLAWRDARFTGKPRAAGETPGGSSIFFKTPKKDLPLWRASVPALRFGATVLYTCSAVSSESSLFQHECS
jgi:hypothetical protein